MDINKSCKPLPGAGSPARGMTLKLSVRQRQRMKAIFRLFTVLMAVVLAGCGSSPAPVQIGLVYVVGQGSNTIQGFSEKSDGELNALPVSSFNTNPRPVSIAFTPAKDFLYVANFTSNTVSGYSVN